jgi:hypothetical protein
MVVVITVPSGVVAVIGGWLAGRGRTPAANVAAANANSAIPPIGGFTF